MCGIFGYVGFRPAARILLNGLRKLEYRGYDSAGLAVIDTIGSTQAVLHRIRAKGKLHNLEHRVTAHFPPATVGISHTRWATHGKAEEHNAHPHLDYTGRVAVIQNGIVENYRLLRQQLQAAGVVFASDTDTEVIPHLIRHWLNQGYDLLPAVQATVNQLEGSFALAVISADHPQEVIAARHHAPLAIGYGQGESFLASDVCAFLDVTNRALVLENGELARLTPAGVEIFTFAGQPVKRTPMVLDWNPVMVEKQGYRHFMLKEIYEQPATLRAGLVDRIQPGSPQLVNLGLRDHLFTQTRQIHIVGCGTSWHAALVGKFLLEQWAQIPTQVHYASEYRYSPPPPQPGSLLIGVTQSGETADTLAALHLGQQRGDYLLGITNRRESSVGRLVHECLDLRAGVEIGVAATKTFTAQLLAFYLLSLEFCQHRQTMPLEYREAIVQGLQQLPALMEGILESQARAIEELAHRYTDTRDFIYLGRGINYPIALEGALKLKEISYIHAEGYPAGEMKHGPIALLDRHVPVVAIAVPGGVYEKVLSNAQEAKARDAQLVGVVAADDYSATEIFDICLPVPTVPEILSPFVTVMPLQLLAYAVAALKGLDVDQPRNLAKSVTVE